MKVHLRITVTDADTNEVLESETIHITEINNPEDIYSLISPYPQGLILSAARIQLERQKKGE